MKKVFMILFVLQVTLFASLSDLENEVKSYVTKQFYLLPFKKIKIKYEDFTVEKNFAVVKVVPIYEDGSHISTAFIEDIVYHLCLEKIEGKWKIVYDLSRTDVPSKQQMKEIDNSFPHNFPKKLLSIFWQDLFNGVKQD